jgi:cytoskeletal protein RodZ
LNSVTAISTSQEAFMHHFHFAGAWKLLGIANHFTNTGRPMNTTDKTTTERSNASPDISKPTRDANDAAHAGNQDSSSDDSAGQSTTTESTTTEHTETTGAEDSSEK